MITPSLEAGAREFVAHTPAVGPTETPRILGATVAGRSFEVYTRSNDAWRLAECELDEAGIRMPFSHRLAVARSMTGVDPRFIVVRDGSGRCRAGLAVEVAASRALPGHKLLRVRHCGAGLNDPIDRTTLFQGLQKLSRQSRALSVNVELFTRDAALRAGLDSTLATLGFRSVEPRSYVETIGVDVTPDRNDILASFKPNARRSIKTLANQAVSVRPIEDTTLAPRLASLLAETMARTGGHVKPDDWAGRIELSRAEPTLSRMVGLFRSDSSGPESLLAFAWGCHHGDHVVYEAGASTRLSEIKVPLLYGLMWDLIIWAKDTGASWYDFGGVTAGRANDPNDPLGGISDFKRKFSTTVLTVGSEWRFEPYPTRSRVARSIGALAARVSRLRHSSRTEPRPQPVVGPAPE